MTRRGRRVCLMTRVQLQLEMAWDLRPVQNGGARSTCVCKDCGEKRRGEELLCNADEAGITRRRGKSGGESEVCWDVLVGGDRNEEAECRRWAAERRNCLRIGCCSGPA